MVAGENADVVVATVEADTNRSVIVDGALAEAKDSLERDEVLSHLDEDGQCVEIGHEASVRSASGALNPDWDLKSERSCVILCVRTS